MMEMVCAWCSPLQGESSDEISHGICEEHAEQLLLESAMRQFNKIPSYVEQNAKAFAEECSLFLRILEDEHADYF